MAYCNPYLPGYDNEASSHAGSTKAAPALAFAVGPKKMQWAQLHERTGLSGRSLGLMYAIRPRAAQGTPSGEDMGPSLS